ncbi:hypothetical protein TNCV_4392761 [Trichonephila clavipes]|nr:hypothetical protein TNCV_4392761 [Trichonephila clavipes]
MVNQARYNNNRSIQFSFGVILLCYRLSHVELDDQNGVLRVWLLFPYDVGVKARGKVASYANAKGIGRGMVPINRRSATGHLNRNLSFLPKRNHFPLKPACSSSIHESQRGTFGGNVYKYS